MARGAHAKSGGKRHYTHGAVQETRPKGHATAPRHGKVAAAKRSRKRRGGKMPATPPMREYAGGPAEETGEPAGLADEGVG